MPLKTAEEKKKAIKWIIGQIKSFGIGLAASFVTVGAFVILKADPYIREVVDDTIKSKDGSKSFREILGEQMDVPSDVVPYYISDKIDLLDSLSSDINDFRNKYMPHIENEMSIIPLYGYIDIETGQEYRFMRDGRAHPVMIDTLNVKWMVYNNRRLNLKDAWKY